MGSKIDNNELPLDKAIDADALFMEMTRSPRHESDATPIPDPSSKNNGAPQASDTSATVASPKEPSPPYEQASTSEALTIEIDARRGTNLGRRASDHSTVRSGRRASDQSAVRSGRRASDRTEEQRFRDVWTTLRSIDCNALSKRSQGSIHWYDVLDLLMAHFPQTSWESLPDTHHADGSVEVGGRVTINGVSRTSTLPVETTSGESLPGPNAKQVSQARMDCWVSCVALFGLGLDIQKQTTH